MCKYLYLTIPIPQTTTLFTHSGESGVLVDLMNKDLYVTMLQTPTTTLFTHSGESGVLVDLMNKDLYVTMLQTPTTTQFTHSGESGVLVGQISKDLMRQYNGYLCKKSTSKTVIQDVFRRGDSAFISGE